MLVQRMKRIDERSGEGVDRLLRFVLVAKPRRVASCGTSQQTNVVSILARE